MILLFEFFLLRSVWIEKILRTTSICIFFSLPPPLFFPKTVEFQRGAEETVLLRVAASIPVTATDTSNKKDVQSAKSPQEEKNENTAEKSQLLLSVAALQEKRHQWLEVGWDIFFGKRGGGRGMAERDTQG